LNNRGHVHPSGIFTEAKEIRVKDIMIVPSFPRCKSIKIMREQDSCRLVLVLQAWSWPWSCIGIPGLGLAGMV